MRFRCSLCPYDTRVIEEYRSRRTTAGWRPKGKEGEGKGEGEGEGEDASWRSCTCFLSYYSYPSHPHALIIIVVNMLARLDAVLGPQEGSPSEVRVASSPHSTAHSSRTADH